MNCKKTLLATFLLAAFAGCDNQNLFDQLQDNRLKIVLKGSYESNDPRSWDTSSDGIKVIPDDSITLVNPDEYDESYNKAPTVFKMDIAEMRLNSDKFANYRKMYTCAVNDSDPYFNGTGVEYKNDDVTAGKYYSSINIFIRKMIFDNANVFNITDGSWTKKSEAIFNEETTDGYDFNGDQVYSLYDSLRQEMYYTNRVFPLSVLIDGGFVADSSENSVIEVRFVIKNYIKKYEIIKYDDSYIPYAYHVFGLSDWLRDVRPGETTEFSLLSRNPYMGGNLLAVARAYNPSQVGTITVPVTVNGYVMAIPELEDVSNYDSPEPANSRPGDDYNPIYPSSLSSTMGTTFLNYYNEMQKYNAEHKLYYTHFFATDASEYASTWAAYESKRSAYKIPPIVTYGTAGSNAVLRNVPVGKRFDIYTAADPGAGAMPVSWTQMGSTVVITDAGGNVTP